MWTAQQKCKPNQRQNKTTETMTRNSGYIVQATMLPFKGNRNPTNGKATMFRKPRLRRKAVCGQIKLQRLRYPRKHATMAHRHDDTDATRHSHTLSRDRKNKHRRKTARQTHTTIHAYKQRHITQGTMHYSKSIPSKSILGLLLSFFTQTIHT